MLDRLTTNLNSGEPMQNERQAATHFSSYRYFPPARSVFKLYTLRLQLFTGINFCFFAIVSQTAKFNTSKNLFCEEIVMNVIKGG